MLKQTHPTILIVPPAAQLRLSSRRPSRKRTDKEREAALNRKWSSDSYRRTTAHQILLRAIANQDTIDMLVKFDWLDEKKSRDKKAVNKAFAEWLDVTVKLAWKYPPLKKPRPLSGSK